jgi:tetratricopeptide (TPR) repeat protein
MANGLPLETNPVTVMSPSDDEKSLLVSLYQQQHYSEAEKLARDLIQRFPEHGFAWKVLGIVLQAQGKIKESIHAKETAVRLSPNDAVALNNLGNAYQQQNRLAEAEACLRHVLKLDPNSATALNNLGLTLEKQQRLEEAKRCYQQAITLQPDYGIAYYNYGNSLQKQECFKESENYYRQALRLLPDYSRIYSNLAYSLMMQSQLQEAEAYYRQGIALEPNAADMHYNLALLLLVKANFVEGWREYQWFYHPNSSNLSKPKPPNIPAKQWCGEPLQNKSVLIVAEQGFGDMIQFVRYAQHLQGIGAKVWVLVLKPLVEIFKTIPWIEEVVEKGAEAQVSCDFWTFPLALPFRFQTTLTSIPATVPYLSVDMKKSAWWKIWLDKQIPLGNKRIGLVWAGNPGQGHNKYRSLALSQFTVFTNLPNITFVSLQLGKAAQELKNIPSGLNILDASPFIQDFSDSSGLLNNLDVLITVCSAPAHLAGALDLPVWTIISKPYDWRWLLEGSTSVWYKSMRLFRQPERGDWTSVLNEVKAELLKL